MYILGISCYYHDSSACLLKDGKILAAAEEERFSRKKHDTSFPLKAIEYCLKEAGITSKDLNYIGFYEKPFIKFERLMSQHLEKFPWSYISFLKSMPSWINEKLRLPTTIKKKLKYKGPILFVDHHLAHAASSYLSSPFKRSAILTVDGVGEWATTTYGVGEDKEVKLLKELKFPHSLGLLYSAVTAHLGFSVNNSEYKVMGLSPYGKPIYYANFRKLIDVKEDGSYRLDMSYFVYHYKMQMPGSKFIKEFGPIRKPESEVTQHHKDIAASLQKITEDVLFSMLNHLHKETKSTNLCMAGGVALNSVANGKIIKNTPFKKVFIQPAAGDGGTSMGAALYIYNSILGNKREYIQKHCYLGPGFTTEEIESFLQGKGVKYSKFENEKELIQKTAKLIYKDNVVGWFQGRMEWGPRALGSRSILSNATNPKMQEILNAKVKHREKFRPFAPVVTLKDAKKYFETDRDEVPFMLFVYPIKEKYHKIIPSVTHVDGTGRLQTITKEQNELYHDVIKEFEKLSKIPILINTSFNIRGEPIVCTPENAYRCMMGTGIDYLIIDKFLIARSNNPQHMWNSEGLAKD